MPFVVVFYLRPLLFLFFLVITSPLLLGPVLLWRIVESYLPFFSDFEVVFIGIPGICWILGCFWLTAEAIDHLIVEKMPLIETFKTVFIDAWGIFSFFVSWLLHPWKKKSA